MLYEDYYNHQRNRNVASSLIKLNDIPTEEK